MWRILQLADSAFPTGGFAHSAGLEAALHAGTVHGSTGVARFVEQAILATAHGLLPFVSAAHRGADVDARCAATLWSHVATRASRAQGRSLVDVAARSFGIQSLMELRARIATEATPGHLAPMFGVVTCALDVSVDDALATFLHLQVRSLLSAAVRLGALGPTEAQALHGRLDPQLDAALALAKTLTIDDVAQTSPLAELVQAGQDRLYTRLFQS
ncbi:MAG TPA: urease accessory UreF family protein [Kofleriaceae bacterium]|jgi:urease accessory protein